MKNRYNSNDRRTRLIRCGRGGNYYLCVFEEGGWVTTGTEKNVRDLHPLLDGKKYNFYISSKAKDSLIRASRSKKFQKLVNKLLVID